MSRPEAEEEGSRTPAEGREAGVDAYLRLKKASFLFLFLLVEQGLILFTVKYQLFLTPSLPKLKIVNLYSPETRTSLK